MFILIREIMIEYNKLLGNKYAPCIGQSLQTSPSYKQASTTKRRIVIDNTNHSLLQVGGDGFNW